MKGKVLFFDDDTGLARGFADALTFAGFELVRVGSPPELEREMAVGSAEALVFGAPLDPVKSATCLSIIGAFPRFPVLAVVPNDCEFERSFPRDEIHDLVRPLSRRRDCVRRLEALIRVGHLHVRLERAERLARDREDVGADASGPYFETLELALVIDKTLKYFAARVPCANIFWVEAAEFQRFALAVDRAESSQSFNRSIKVRAVHETDPDSIVTQVQEFVKLVAAKPESASQVRKLTEGGRAHLLMPIRDDEKGVALAYLLFEDLRGGGADVEKMILNILAQMSRHLRFSIEYWNAQNQAFIDDLTDLYNQRYLPLVLENEISRAQRHKKAFCVLFMDVDYFKSVNDTRGHWIGSKVLVELGRLLKGSVRSSDYAFRYGGDEFVIVLPDTEVGSAQIVAERVRKKIAGTTFRIDGVDLNVTVSIGLAAFPDHAQTSEQVIQMADQAMYYGKNRSRNIVYIAS